VPEHGAPSGDGARYAEPLTATPDVPRRSAAEEARTLVASTTVAALATLSEDGTPWSSLVRFATLPDGAPVLVVSTMAEHGRNLLREPRASLCVAAGGDGDPLDRGRVTVVGAVRRPDDDAPLAVYEAAVPTARGMAAYTDFGVWVLDVDRVRWVGGFARMDTVTASDYAGARPDPVAPAAAGALAHLNADHADALLDIARALTGHPDATQASATALDRFGIDLRVATPRGPATARAGWDAPLTSPGQLRAASVELVRRARVTG
jgi:putative heme iron utilization protein